MANPVPVVSGYEDLTRVGTGGFSTVYRARQVQFDRVVALKVLSNELVDDQARRRFERECRAAGRLSDHPNVVTVHDAGVTEDGRPYIACQFMESGSLKDRLDSGGPLPVTEVLDIGVKLSGALAAVHAAGLLHRDVKPQNVLLSEFGEPALADFGISAIVRGSDATTGTASLTPLHSAPEVLEGEATTAASDVYSLGSTLYSLLAGRAPFEGLDGEGLLPFLRRLVSDPVPPIGRDDVPNSLFDVLRQALEKDSSERQSSATELGRALQAQQTALGINVTKLLEPTLRLDADAAPGDGGDLSTTAGPIPEDPDLDQTLTRAQTDLGKQAAELIGSIATSSISQPMKADPTDLDATIEKRSTHAAVVATLDPDQDTADASPSKRVWIVAASIAAALLLFVGIAAARTGTGEVAADSNAIGTTLVGAIASGTSLAGLDASGSSLPNDTQPTGPGEIPTIDGQMLTNPSQLPNNPNQPSNNTPTAPGQPTFPVPPGQSSSTSRPTSPAASPTTSIPAPRITTLPPTTTTPSPPSLTLDQSQTTNTGDWEFVWGYTNRAQVGQFFRAGTNQNFVECHFWLARNGNAIPSDAVQVDLYSASLSGTRLSVGSLMATSSNSIAGSSLPEYTAGSASEQTFAFAGAPLASGNYYFLAVRRTGSITGSWLPNYAIGSSGPPGTYANGAVGVKDTVDANWGTADTSDLDLTFKTYYR